MHLSRDNSNRISRLSKQEPQRYLSRLKGARYSKYREQWEFCGGDQGLPDNPLQLNVEITASCNLRCKMCYRNYGSDFRNGQLSLETIKTIANQFEELQIPSLWISGGEPLVHPQIIDILHVFGETKPIDFWMVTNGLLLTEDIVNAIIDSGITWLSVSIDAVSEQTYAKIRGGNYNELIQKLQMFLDVRDKRKSVLPFLRVSFVKMAENQSEEKTFFDYWREKADIIDIQTLADYTDLDQFSLEDAINSTFHCTAPFTLLSVLPNGDFIPCCNGFYMGKSTNNISNTSIREYWESEFHKKFALSVKNHQYCNECIKCVKSFLPREK